MIERPPIPEIKGLVNPEEYRRFARGRFMEAVTQFDPGPIKQLRDQYYPLFLRSLPTMAIPHPAFAPETESSGLLKGRNKLFQDLSGWQEKWSLMEPDGSESWVREWVVRSLFPLWRRFPECDAKYALLPNIDDDICFEPSPEFIAPSFLLKDPMTGIHFVPRSKKGHHAHVLREYKRLHIGSIRAIEKRIEKERWIQYSDISVRDLFWAIRSQISDDSYSELSEIDKIKLFREPHKSTDGEKDKKRPIVLEVKRVHPSTVSRAVKKILLLVGIEPRFKKTDKRVKRTPNKNVIYRNG